MTILGLTAVGMAAAGCGSSAAATQAAAKSAANQASASLVHAHPGARVVAARFYKPTGEWIVAYKNPNGAIGYAAYDAHGRPAVLPASLAAHLK
jgi:hypothetical protein